jgi:hypothetical protein
MNVLSHDDLSKSLGIHPDVEFAGGRCLDFELSVRPRSGLAQSLTLFTGIVTDQLNRSIIS